MSRRRRRASLNTRLNDARTPVFVLDHRRQVVFFNAGCEDLTGWAAAEVVGQICDYATGVAAPDDSSDWTSGTNAGERTARTANAGALAALTGGMCPPPDVLAGRPQSVPTYLPHRDGRALGRQIHFFPLVDAEGRVESVFGLITPLDQPRSRGEPMPAQRLHAELASLRLGLRQRFSRSSLVCADPSMQRVLVQVNLARITPVPVTFIGEPGTGREHFARVIHYEGPARSRAFVPLDCRRTAAIDLKLALRRLLGTETADRDADEDTGEPQRETGEPRPGVGRALLPVSPGTLYLANAESLPRDLQEMVVSSFAARVPAKGLRHASASRSSDARDSADADIRLMVSTTADPDALLSDETWRPDFCFLVTPLRIELPPLRRRPDELELLAQHLLESHNRSSEIQIGGFSEAVWAKFREYNWPGNIDELAAVIQEARVAAADAWRNAAETSGRPALLIGLEHLPFRFRTGLDAQSLGPRPKPRAVPLEPYLEQIEREHIVAALEQTRFSKKRAADLLGMTRPRLYRRMQALGIADPEGNGDEPDSPPAEPASSPAQRAGSTNPGGRPGEERHPHSPDRP